MNEYYEYKEQGYKNKITINVILIAVNIIVFFVMEFMGSTEDVRFMLDHGASYWPAIYYDKEYYRILTSSFMHYGIEHLISNMLVLGIVGEHLENALGKVRYLIFYLSSAILSGIVSYEWDRYFELNNVSAGASGAVFAVAGGIILVLLIDRWRISQIGLGRIGLFVVFSLYSGFRNSSVNNVAHVSGVIIGFILAGVLFLTKRRRQRSPY